jgi:hypothetical protein
VSVCIAPLLLLLIGGCAASAPDPAIISLKSASGGRGFAQTFPHAYFSQSDDGDRQVVLIDDGRSKIVAPPTAGPIQPTAALPLQQVMQFKILWNPLPGTHTDAPSTTNAVIDWTIRAAPAGEQGDSIHYRGAGFVEVDGDSQRLTLTIRSVTLEPTSRTGSLVDPLGTCSLNGTFTAVRDDGMVQSAIADLQAQPVEAAARMDPIGSAAPPRAPSAP